MPCADVLRYRLWLVAALRLWLTSFHAFLSGGVSSLLIQAHHSITLSLPALSLFMITPSPAGYERVDGEIAGDATAPSAKLWTLVDPNRTKQTLDYLAIVRATELDSLKRKVEALEAEKKNMLSLDKKRGGGKKLLIERTMGAAIEAAAKDVARRERQLEKDRAADLMYSAIDFLGLKSEDVAGLRVAFNAMDVRRKGSVRLKRFFAYAGVERSPVYDAIFYFMDASFDGKVDFGTFLRTVCTFCMFGAGDMTAWVYSVVAAGATALAERGDALYKRKRYKPGRAGFDLATRDAVYWEGVVKFSALPDEARTRGSMTLASFTALMHHIHAPTGGATVAVKRAIERAGAMVNEVGILSPEDFRAIAGELPAILSPLFIAQTELRAAFMGEAWWGAKRQLFADARALLREQYEFSARMVLLAREEARKAAEEEMRALLAADAEAAAEAARLALGGGGGGKDKDGAAAAAGGSGGGGGRRDSMASIGSVDSLVDRISTAASSDAGVE